MHNTSLPRCTYGRYLRGDIKMKRLKSERVWEVSCVLIFRKNTYEHCPRSNHWASYIWFLWTEHMDLLLYINAKKYVARQESHRSGFIITTIEYLGNFRRAINERRDVPAAVLLCSTCSNDHNKANIPELKYMKFPPWSLNFRENLQFHLPRFVLEQNRDQRVAVVQLCSA